jgi:hypothetical protein
MSRTGLSAGVAAAFLVFLVAGAPASLLQHLAPRGIEISGPQGSIWSGEASAVRLGDLQLGTTRWVLTPLPLLLGRLAGEVDATLPGGLARGSFVIGAGGWFRVTNFAFAVPLASLAALQGNTLPFREGQLSAQLTELEVHDGWPTRAIGEIRVGDVALIYRGGRPDMTRLANFRVEFNADEVPPGGVIEGQLTDQGGPVAVSGVLLASPPGNYEISGRAATRPGAPVELEQALVMLGPASPDGGRDFSIAGSL